MRGILYVLKYFLALLNELNKMFQYRLLTYNGVKAELERAKRGLKLQFLGDKGVKVNVCVFVTLDMFDIGVASCKQAVLYQEKPCPY